MIRHSGKKLKTTYRDGKIYHAHELEELIKLKWPYDPRKSRDSVQFLSKYPWILHRTRTNNSKICMETRNIPNIQNYHEKEEQSWRYHAPWFLTVRQSYSNQSSIVLAQVSMEQHRQPRMKPYLYGQLVYKKGGKNTQWGKESSSINDVGEIGQLHGLKT